MTPDKKLDYLSYISKRAKTKELTELGTLLFLNVALQLNSVRKLAELLGIDKATITKTNKVAKFYEMIERVNLEEDEISSSITERAEGEVVITDRGQQLALIERLKARRKKEEAEQCHK